jgi:hypothetical protein
MNHFANRYINISTRMMLATKDPVYSKIFITVEY